MKEITINISDEAYEILEKAGTSFDYVIDKLLLQSVKTRSQKEEKSWVHNTESVRAAAGISNERVRVLIDNILNRIISKNITHISELLEIIEQIDATEREKMVMVSGFVHIMNLV